MDTDTGDLISSLNHIESMKLSLVSFLSSISYGEK